MADSLSKDLKVAENSLEAVSLASQQLQSLKKELRALESERDRARERMQVVVRWFISLLSLFG
jgi:uncharacterized protein YigA (DUF484 family)